MNSKLSIGITTYNSASWVIKQLNLNYINNLEELVDEIVIQDDCSNDFNILKQYESKNIKIFTNKQNLSPLYNRVELLKNCKNDWVLIIDSDNSIRFTSESGSSWIDVVKNFDLSDKKTIYCPGFINHSSYNNIIGKRMDLSFFKKNFNDPEYYLQTFGNAGNYIVPRKEYLEVSKQIDPSFCGYIGEVLYFNYLWLINGNYIACKKDFEYNHIIRQDSYTITNFERSKDTLRKIHNFFT